MPVSIFCKPRVHLGTPSVRLGKSSLIASGVLLSSSNCLLGRSADMEVPCRSTLHLQLKAVDAVYSVLELLLQGGVAVRELLPHFEEDALHHGGSEVRRFPQFYSCLPENIEAVVDSSSVDSQFCAKCSIVFFYLML